eukprot:COSAG03_NODE_3193_length_2151_cov_6.491228_1_plen_117_part_00
MVLRAAHTHTRIVKERQRETERDRERERETETETETERAAKERRRDGNDFSYIPFVTVFIFAVEAFCFAGACTSCPYVGIMAAATKPEPRLMRKSSTRGSKQEARDGDTQPDGWYR